MFARVNYNRNIRNTLDYNERKLRLGKAECLLAENFMKDADRLSRTDKLYRFERLNILNEKTKANALHISLSFHPSEKLDNDQMKELASQYMKKLHLDHQPYLAYRHNDTGHPHLHIVSTLIQPDGNRLKLDNILRWQSLRITREMEEQFSLVRFYRPEKIAGQRLSQTSPREVVYGEPGRKEAVAQVLHHVINRYNYTSMTELNAVLRLYNVKAKIVWDKQALKKPRGLMYHTLDEKGHVIGVSFKSSSFVSQPTLKKLEQKFTLNQSLRQQEARRVTTAIDWAFATKTIGWEDFKNELLGENIHIVLEKDKAGDRQSIYYVDMSKRCAFDGEAMGNRYNNEGIKARCASEEQLRLEEFLKPNHRHRLRLHL
jgi:hypothetical protein